jgi:molybdate transport system regulatory protein
MPNSAGRSAPLGVAVAYLCRCSDGLCSVLRAGFPSTGMVRVPVRNVPTLSKARASTMTGARLTIRIDLKTGEHIGPGKIQLLEAIRSSGSITAAARSIGMSYRRAWLLVEEINRVLREPAVTAVSGGVRGGGSVVTPVGKRIVGLYHAIELQAQTAAADEFRDVGELIRRT